eukprot:TRINITY_DN25375_c0_g1_i1.p1 TRINITY_DN25375_c0_g1~~TRINITY_DN25375_c0_g1_i1.p1  ORF type:complete len:544 (-),score=81.90 TRINITY_DN25375_c0_g1_i1:123-1754(-)
MDAPLNSAAQQDVEASQPRPQVAPMRRSRRRTAIIVLAVILVCCAVGLAITFASTGFPWNHKHQQPLQCHLDHCSDVELPFDATSCDQASCKACSDGYDLAHDQQGKYCALSCRIDHCKTLVVHRDTATCQQATCRSCSDGYTVYRDIEGQYCGLSCNVEHCGDVSVPRSAASCDKAICNSCYDGYREASDDEGEYCSLTCGLPNCAATSISARHVKDCAHANTTCEHCNDGWQLDIDRKTMEYTGNCSFACTDDQVAAGCAPYYCSSSTQCSTCIPGYTVKTSSTPDSTAVSSCEAAKSTVPMTFYMYRAQSQSTYPPENCDLASASGVMWYLANEVVDRRMSCPRHYDITRVLRYRVKVFNPPAVHQPRNGQLGHFVQFDGGKCTVPHCDDNWKQFGYMVGCQLQSGSFHYPGAAWYSLPGRCTSLRYDDPNKKACMAAHPGGQCASPDSTTHCTWHTEDAGEVSVDELSGIKDHAAFCKAGYWEYDDETDSGNGTSFWNDKADLAQNQRRVLKLLQLFAEKYPGEHTTALALPDPHCDGW